MTTQTAPKPNNRPHPGEKQSAASNPQKNVWVGASAGTGKTKVLIDRVLRQMLPRLDGGAATAPEKILCLTFTKTAAAEMSNRIYQRLSEWSVMNDSALAKNLAGLIGAEPTTHIQAEARRLFARVLDAPGGLKIMTIHSFCQSVLKRFPIEAGLPPHFQLMDEQNAVEYLTKCLHDIIADTKIGGHDALAAAFSRLALLLNAEEMSDLMAKIMAKRSLLAEVLRFQGDDEGSAVNTIAAIRTHLKVADGDSEEKVLHDIMTGGDDEKLREALRAQLQGSAEDQKRAANMEPWLANPADRLRHLSDYRDAFFTSGEIRKRLATKKVQDIYPQVLEVMQAEAERLYDLNLRNTAIRLADINGAMLTVASELVGRYAAYKRSHDCLDFDDLIIRTCALLSDADAVQWVLFKLDQGIDHILVDEAQDTSPYQWRVVRALADEFFAGAGTRDDVIRTLFVVGDEKQSIFSFQGADPYEFARMQNYFGDKVRDVQEGWEIVLDYSFRSTRTVLTVVDQLFNDMAVKRGVVSDIMRDVLHLPFRDGHAGLVELWPLMKPADKVEADAWQMPTQVAFGDNAAIRLAEKMAKTVKGWIDNGDMLPSKGRPIRAGDVLVLVQSRSALVEQIMRALKEQGVPVAGIDRMTLTQEICVMDLLAVAEFALLPKDDLALAVLLKTPLVGMSEEMLFDICHGRTGSLWTSLRETQPAIAAWIKPLLEKAGRATPYEFFAEILQTPCYADAFSGRRALQARLGTDIFDALDEFLNSCLQYEQTHTPSLQKFVDWFKRGEAQIKREQEGGKTNQVRIMTVHASKGLQAPIVFLPDTVKILHDHNKGRARLLWPEDETGVPLWSPRGEFDAPAYETLRVAAADKQDEEYRRLMYVALTRAEDRLYIGGYLGLRKPAKDNCWYKMIERSFPTEAERIGNDDDYVLRLQHPQEVPPQIEDKAQETLHSFEPLPAWAMQPPRAEPSPSQPLTPSKPGEDEPAAKGPLASDEGWKFRRGVIVHQILETLPQLPPDRWERALAAYLSRLQLSMPADEQKNFAAEVLAVLRHPEFAPIFGPASRAEVPVVGLAKASQVVSGQMDRIVVTETDVLIIDYKTNRPPPKDEAGVAVVYLKQMASYINIMQKVYPDKKVKAALLWTDGPYLMPLSDKSLDPYL